MTALKWTKQQWVWLKDRKVWFIGYHREYLPSSAEVKQVVIAENHDLISVCEHEITPWVEERRINHAMLDMSDIWNLSNIDLIDLTRDQMALTISAIRNKAAIGLGLRPREDNA